MRQGVIENCNLKESLLKNKPVAISIHKTREYATADICHTIKIRSDHNFSYLLTNSVTDIGRHQVMVIQWVSLRQLLEVCVQKTGF